VTGDSTVSTSVGDSTAPSRCCITPTERSASDSASRLVSIDSACTRLRKCCLEDNHTEQPVADSECDSTRSNASLYDLELARRLRNWKLDFDTTAPRDLFVRSHEEVAEGIAQSGSARGRSVETLQQHTPTPSSFNYRAAIFRSDPHYARGRSQRPSESLSDSSSDADGSTFRSRSGPSHWRNIEIHPEDSANIERQPYLVQEMLDSELSGA
jgi:hypothetical protein